MILRVKGCEKRERQRSDALPGKGDEGVEMRVMGDR